MPPLKHPARIIRTHKPGCGKSAAPQGNSHFPGHGRTNLRTTVLVRKRPAQEAEPEYIRDVRTLTATALRLKYPTTYDSWKNMKSRRKTQGAIITSEFEVFSNFLAIQGPRPTPAYTLDRLDNDNPTYGPGLCQWRDKSAQANNRRSTIYLTHDGECRALSEWARLKGHRPDTLRKRKLAGWSDSEIITGMRTTPNQPAEFPWPSNTPEGRELWEQYWIDSNVHDPLDFILGVTKRKRDELEEFLCENIGDDGTADHYPDQTCEFDRLDKCYRRYLKMHDRRERQAEAERRNKVKAQRRSLGDWLIADIDEEDDLDEE